MAAADTTISSQIRQSFSPARDPDQSAQPCPLANKDAPDKPCNLQRLNLTEPSAEPLGKPGARSADILKDAERVRTSCPVILASGADAFQITAKSAYNPPRQVALRVVSDACCDSSTHPVLDVSGPDQNGAGTQSSRTLQFVRPPRPGDDGAFESGIWVILNALFREDSSPQVYQIDASDCGLPASSAGAPTPALSTRIEVFPADQYEFSLSLPALLKPDSLKFEGKSDSWKSDEELEADANKKELDAYYKDYGEFFREAGVSRSDVRELADNMSKKASGEDDADFVGQISIKLKQVDGTREIEAPVDDVIKLVRFIRNAEYRIKSIEKWIDNLQVGPGVSFTIDAQFFQGKVKIKWGYQESGDERVFRFFTGSLDFDVIKLSADISVGFKFCGACDLLLVIAGEGSLGISCPEVSKRSPDDDIEVKITPRGELKLTGKLASTLMWTIKGEAGVECEFKTNFDEFSFLGAGGAFGGTIRIERGAVYRVVTVSSGFWGFGGSKTDKAEIIPEDKSFVEFDIS